MRILGRNDDHDDYYVDKGLDVQHPLLKMLISHDGTNFDHGKRPTMLKTIG